MSADSPRAADPTSNPQARTTFYGWYLVGVIWIVLFINSGFPFYGAGILNASMARAMDVDKDTLGLGFGLMTLLSSLSAPLVALIIRRAGVRAAFVLGSLLVMIGAALMATIVKAGWQYVLVFGVIVGLGAGLGTTIAAQSSMALWFRQRRATAIAIVTTATGVGGFLLPPLLNFLIGPSGGQWRLGWFLVAVLALGAALLSQRFVKNSPADIGEVPDGHAAVAQGEEGPGKGIHRSDRDWTVVAALRTRSFWIATFAALTFSAAFFTYVAHGVIHLQEFGHSTTVGAMALSLVGLSSLVGRLLAGWLADRIEPRYVWAGCMMIAAIGLFILADAPGRASVVVFAVLLGVGYSGAVISWAATLSNYFGAVSYPAIVGVQALIVGPLSAAAPPVAGLAYECTGSYTVALLSIATMLAAAGLLMLASKPPRTEFPRGAEPS